MSATPKATDSPHKSADLEDAFRASVDRSTRDGLFPAALCVAILYLTVWATLTARYGVGHQSWPLEALPFAVAVVLAGATWRRRQWPVASAAPAAILTAAVAIHVVGTMVFWPNPTHATIVAIFVLAIGALQWSWVLWGAATAVLAAGWWWLARSSLLESVWTQQQYVVYAAVATSAVLLTIRRRAMWRLVIEADLRQQREHELSIALDHLGIAAAQHAIILDSLPVISYTCRISPDMPTTYISANVKQITGFDPGRFIDDPSFFVQRLHPEDADKALPNLDRINGNPSADSEYRWQVADGSYRWFSDSYRVVYNDDGDPSHVVGMWQDITQRKADMDALHENESRFRELFENSPDAIFVEQFDGTVLDVNDAACSLHGMTREQLIGKRVLDLVPPEHRPSVERDFPSLVSGEVDVVEGFSLTQDGRSVPVEIRYARIDYADQPALLLHVRDVTERKQAERVRRESESRYRSLFQDSPISLWEEDFSAVKQQLDQWREQGVADLRRHLDDHPSEVARLAGLVRIVHVNNETLRMYGAHSVESFSQSLNSILHEDSLAVFKEELINFFDGNTHYQAETRTYRLDNGDPVDVDVTVSVASGHEHDLSKVYAATIDISERLQSAKALHESEHRQALILETVPVAFFTLAVVGRQHRWSWISENWERVTGYAGEEVFTDEPFWSDRIHPDDYDRVRTLEKSVLEQGDVHMEYRWKCGSGEYRWFHEYMVLVAGQDGQPSEIRGVLMDIHDRRRAEQERLEAKRELTVTEARQSLILNTVPLALYTSRIENGRFNTTWISDQVDRITGFKPEIFRTHKHFWSTRVHPDDRESIRRLVDQDLDRGEAELEYRWQCADGEYRWFEDHVVVMRGDDDAPTEVFGTWVDIHERKVAELERQEAEKALRLTQFSVDRTNDAVYWLTPTGKVSYANEAASRALGYSRDELLRLEVFDFGVNLSRELWGERWRRLKQIGSTQFEAVHRRKDGTEFPVDVTANYIEFDGHAFNFAFVRDISQRKHDELEKAQLQEELTEARTHEALGAFASGVAHDFDNLLAAMSGYLTLASQHEQTHGDVRRSLAQIEMAIGQARRVTRSLLTFAGQRRSHIARVDLAAVVGESIPLLRHLVPDKAHLTFQASEKDVWIDADIVQMQRILMNLTVNAGEHLAEDGHIHIAVSRQAGGAQLVVSDDGAGIDPEIQSRIFEPFFSTKVRGEGTGLGLAVVHGIVEKHHGTIVIESKPGHGTRFTMNFPAYQPAQPRLVRASTGNAERIVLVQSETYALQMIQHLLESNGYEVVCASDGEQAAQLMSEHAPGTCLAIFDDTTRPASPDPGGDLPAIVLTQEALGSSDTSPGEVLAMGVLAQPFRSEHLLDAVRDGLDRQRSAGVDAKKNTPSGAN